MYKFILLCCSLVFIIGLTACSKDKPQEQASTAQPAQQQSVEAGLAGPPPEPVTGKVLESMDASGYTYINVATDSGDMWIAVNQSAVEVGEEVTFMDGIVMQNFFSKALDRTFPEIIFSSGLLGKETTPPGMPPAGIGADSFSQALSTEGGIGAPAVGDMMTGSKKAVVEFAEIKVEKAAGENSYTVAEIFSKATELNGQTVVIRGKVVKVSPRIMGRNWIHLQDGTGNPEENTHDLVITTLQETGADWDIITMEGVLTANKDFGSGYSYSAIIEDANLKE
ncbi:MAG: DNA-binding protein [Desulfobulbaceae bacterium]|nr:DNA-binding protein [Desulfobulbaceae bacterium]